MNYITSTCKHIDLCNLKLHIKYNHRHAHCRFRDMVLNNYMVLRIKEMLHIFKKYSFMIAYNDSSHMLQTPKFITD